MSSATGYVLGSTEPEIARLGAQAAAIAPPTALLLQAAGIGAGMRVLDLGPGLGHVAFAVAELVGPEGAVVGVDQGTTVLEIADARRRAAALEQVSFEVGDARTFRDGALFDAVVMRLLLFHLPDAVDVLRHHLGALRPGGLIVDLDFALGSSRADPPLALVETILGWIERAFRNAGANPRIGAHLGPLLEEAGVEGVVTLGIQGYFGPEDPRAPAMLAGVARSLAGPIVASGIATEEELEIATLEARLLAAATSARAVIMPPVLAGAWGRRG